VALRTVVFVRFVGGRVREVHRFHRDLAFAEQIGVAPP
jgi:hypothetical protein